MSSSRIKEFVTYAFLKVKLALAFCIILNTPPGKTVVEYAKELQEALFKSLQDNDDPFLAERTALLQQQQTVANHLRSVIPSSVLSSLDTANYSQDSGYNSCDIVDGRDSQISSVFSEYETPLNFSEDVQKTLGASLDFIRGLTRLKDLAGKDDDVENEISGSTSTSKLRTDSEKHEVVRFQNRPNHKVISGVIQYALQSSSAEDLVKKSVQEIQRHLSGIALQDAELPDAILNWEGSLLQHSIAVIRKLSDEKSYRKVVAQSTGALATILITDMLRNYGLEKNIKIEYQVTLLLQLCGNSATCFEVLHILVDKITMISNKSVALHEPESNLSPTERTINFESCFYIFYLTEKLLKRFFALQQTNSSFNENSNKCSRETKITELWRGAWGKNETSQTFQNGPVPQPSDCAKLTQSWCVSLENAAVVFSFSYPLITIYAYNCLKLITANLKKGRSV